MLQSERSPHFEVITSVQRRRRWPTAEKIRLVEETMQPGKSGSARELGLAQPSYLSGETGCNTMNGDYTV
jgi:transposase-like protein